MGVSAPFQFVMVLILIMNWIKVDMYVCVGIVDAEFSLSNYAVFLIITNYTDQLIDLFVFFGIVSIWGVISLTFSFGYCVIKPSQKMGGFLVVRSG
jgi:hypothetical protein